MEHFRAICFLWALLIASRPFGLDIVVPLNVEAAAVAPQSLQTSTNTTHSELIPSPTIWVYNDHADFSSYERLNLLTWHANIGHPMVIINDKNVQQYIPDMPMKEFLKLYAAAKSDVVRAGVLYHHGGLYTDLDFIVLHDVRDLFGMVLSGKYEFVTYGTDSDPTGAHVCRINAHGSFASNWLISRKGGSFVGQWWDKIKHVLTAVCKPGEYRSEARVCCYEEGMVPDPPSCHVPWARIEGMKTNFTAGVNQAMPSAFCLHGNESFVADIDNFFFKNTTDCTKQGLDLVCKSNGKKVPNFYGRRAMHLFHAINGGKLANTIKMDTIFEGESVLADLYRRALSKAAFSTP